MAARPKRTVRKPTRWTADEWRRVEDVARTRGVPALRFVREAALAQAAQGGPPPAPPRRRRPADDLVNELAHVLNNLTQLCRVAEEDWDDDNARLIGAVIDATTAATRAAPERAKEAAAVLARLAPAGVALNELAHRANAAKQLPPDAELHPALVDVFKAVTR